MPNSAKDKKQLEVANKQLDEAMLRLNEAMLRLNEARKTSKDSQL